MPDRIRINSAPLLTLLDNITGRVPSHQPRVYLQPYKSFLYWEDRIMEALEKLKSNHHQSQQADSLQKMLWLTRLAK